jgi:hypothetical protein
LRIDEEGNFCLRNVILAFGTHLDLRAKLKTNGGIQLVPTIWASHTFL